MVGSGRAIDGGVGSHVPRDHQRATNFGMAGVVCGRLMTLVSCARRVARCLRELKLDTINTMQKTKISISCAAFLWYPEYIQGGPFSAQAIAQIKRKVRPQ